MYFWVRLKSSFVSFLAGQLSSGLINRISGRTEPLVTTGRIVALAGSFKRPPTRKQESRQTAFSSTSVRILYLRQRIASLVVPHCVLSEYALPYILWGPHGVVAFKPYDLSAVGRSRERTKWRRRPTSLVTARNNVLQVASRSAVMASKGGWSEKSHIYHR